MTSQKTLKLYVYVDGGINDTPFPNEKEQIELVAFRYEAKRMGGAPIITATLNYATCLDEEWNDYVYATLNGERYFLKQTPTSTKNNNDARYKHELELVSERTILDNTYFYDAVVGTPQENDKPVTNDTKFTFYGNIEEFVKRMNASLQYKGLQKVDDKGKVLSGYHVVLDDDVVTRDEKLLQFENAVFSTALQESYNTFGIPFYFDGKTIHIGFSNNVISDVLEYGVDGALISASKNNANFKVVNRATGSGSSDNIPYYYPNNSPKGAIEAVVDSKSKDFRVEISDIEKFSNDIKVDGTIVCNKTTISNLSESLVRISENSEGRYQATNNARSRPRISTSFSCSKKASATLRVKVTPISAKTATDRNGNSYGLSIDQIDIGYAIYINDGLSYSLSKAKNITTVYEKNGFSGFVNIDIPSSGDYTISVELLAFYRSYTSTSFSYTFDLRHELTFNDTFFWEYEEEPIKIEKIGLRTFGTPNDGDTITQRLVSYIMTSDKLQPSIYRATKGEERFYNAKNYPFEAPQGYELQYGEYIGNDGLIHNDAYKDDNGNYYRFTNEYKEGRPREHVFTSEDIKPTIKEMTNSEPSWIEKDEEGNDITVFQRCDMFSEFAYDEGDSDETYMDEEGKVHFKHPYFFAKLRKMPFNLFEHASESGTMMFSFTSGHCGACNFEMGVSEEEPQFNTVQVYEKDTTENGVFHKKGSLKRDEEGRVLCGLEDFQGKVQPQDMQQDTINYEVWIALKKEDDTYGVLMPKAPIYEGNKLMQAGHRPNACSSATNNDGDTFVILNITLPDEYIYEAEKKLEKAIVKYIWENNVEKFNFSVNFSRIFLEENPRIKETLNENARLTRVRYNGIDYMLYVSSYSYVMNEGDVLPEIRVELDDTLTIAQNALQNAINEVKSDIASAINTIDVRTIGSRYFLQRDVDETTTGTINFLKGVKFGDGGNVKMYNDGSGKLSIDYLEVRKKATFTSLEIQEKTHVGGQIIISPAAMTCSKVEDIYDKNGVLVSWRCYFQSKGEEGEEVLNAFVVGDQAICQTFNEGRSKYYWRLVSEIGLDYIELSVEDCDNESDIPSIGDKIIQLGNRNNKSRQSAQVLSSHGDDAPSFIMYSGIDSFSLVGKDITGIVWNPTTEEPRMYSFGDFFFGDRKLEGNYITFQNRKKEDGTYESEKKLHINADVTLGEGSTGLSNLSEWKTQDAKVTQAANDASEAKKIAEESAKKIEDIIADNVIDEVEKQVLKNELAMIEGSHAQISNDYNIYITEFENVILDGLDGFVTSDEEEFTSPRSEVKWDMYESSYNAYKKDLEDNIAVEDGIPVGNLSESQANYYSNRIALLEEISQKMNTNDKYTQESSLQARKEVTDFEYLKGAFGNAKSMAVQGVVMSQMVAVADVEEGENITEGDVKAFLNGSNFADDELHGKLILAGGISEGEEALKDRSREAATKIYEDGTIDTQKLIATNAEINGKITAEEGQIGPFGINSWQLKSEQVGEEYVDNNVYQRKDTITMSSSSLGVHASITDDQNNRVGYSQCTLYPGAGALYANFAAIIRNQVPAHSKAPDYFPSEETPCIALILSASGANPINYAGWGGNLAIQIENGMIAGLRPQARVITANLYSTNTPHSISKYDHTIIINVSGGTTEISLPSNPEEGQEYLIYTCHAPMDLKIHLNGKGLYDFIEARDNSTGYEHYTSDYRREIKLIFAGGQWWQIYRYLYR